LYTSDRPDNIAWILHDSGASAMVIGGAAQWERLQSIRATVDRLDLLLSVEPFRVASRTRPPANLRWLHEWLPGSAEETAAFAAPTHAEAIATLVYTSGTTGRPKGVMLSHRNILFNVDAGLRAVPVYPADRMLSFLPLSHTLERTIGYYLSMVAGSGIAFARSIPQLAEDLASIRPTLMIAVPRIFERVYARVLETLAGAPPMRRRLFEQAVDGGWEVFLHAQGRAPWSARQLLAPVLDRLVGAKVRARMGGRLRIAISGGAPLPGEVSRFFIGLGVTVLQGYGLTETSPVIAVNRQEDNEPTSVGPALTGVEVRTDAAGELLTRSPSVMQGYWNRPEATRAMIDPDGWLHTGDLAMIGPRGHVTITGRKKEILVLSTGEKVPPADLEQALGRSPWLDQILVTGDGLPALCALGVRSEALHAALAQPEHPLYQASEEEQREFVLEDLRARLRGFPGYAKLAGVALTDTPWTEDNGLLTPTLKLKRGPIVARHAALLEKLEEEVSGVSR
jgi:long-chain acyl-CoA synthetase